MGLLAVIGPSRKENLFLEFLFLVKYLFTRPDLYHHSKILRSISGKSIFGETGLNIVSILLQVNQAMLILQKIALELKGNQ